MASPLKNARHERFAQERARGLSVDEAYAKAGYKRNSSNASRLNGNDSVLARVAELQSRVAAKIEITAEDIARQLDEDRTFARANGVAAAAVSATMGKAKVLGLIVDKSKVDFGPIAINVTNEDANL